MAFNGGLDIRRQRLCDDIKNVFAGVAAKLKIEGRLNHMSTHVYCEDAITGILSATLGLSLVNANVFEHNMPGFDLIDSLNKTIVQVSTDASIGKIRHALGQNTLNNYKGYKLMFMFLVDSHPQYRNPQLKVPDSIDFSITEDVFDFSGLIARIASLPDIRKIEEIHSLVEREFTPIPNQSKLPSGLAWVVNTLGDHALQAAAPTKTAVFNIDAKIVTNGLEHTSSIIHEYAAYTYVLVGIYDEYSKGGKNRLLALSGLLRQRFAEVCLLTDDADEQFHGLIHKLCKELEADLVATAVTREELVLYVTIVVVDAFMRCKIYEGPDVAQTDGDATFSGGGACATT